MDISNIMYPNQFHQGDDVIAADGDKVGTLAEVRGSYLIVEKGFFLPKDYYIPSSAVTTYDETDGKIYLTVTKDEALNSGWDQLPSEIQLGTDTMSTSAMDVGTAARTSVRTDTDRINVPVHEEELIPTKTVREAGRVRVGKDVVEEQREFDVPVTEERVRVTRRTVDRDATTGDTAFQETEFEVPVRTEDVGLDKVVRVAEEVAIEKDAIQDTKRVGGTVRKERVTVDDAGDVITHTDESEWQDPNTTA
jgi:uncharacterized protein (TIGR02271 family)